MIRRLVISLGFAAWATVAVALEPVIAPDCVDGDVEYFASEQVSPGIVSVYSYAPDGETTEWLVSCSAGQAVRATARGAVGEGFYELVVRLGESAETYTFRDVAKLARDEGWDARVVSFPATSCICN